MPKKRSRKVAKKAAKLPKRRKKKAAKKAGKKGILSGGSGTGGTGPRKK